MNKIIIASITTAAVLFGPAAIAQATPDMCGEHADYSDLPNGPGQGSRYITACGGKGGPDWSNGASTPNVDTAPSGGVDPFTVTSNGGRVDTGTADDNQNNQDEDGVQGHDNVTSSPLYVPASVS